MIQAADNKKMELALKGLKEKAEIMLFAFQNDKDFPEIMDLKMLADIDDDVRDINSILVRNFNPDIRI